MEKNRVINQSLTQSPSLFDALGTEAFTSTKVATVIWKEWWIKRDDLSAPFKLRLNPTMVKVT